MYLCTPIAVLSRLQLNNAIDLSQLSACMKLKTLSVRESGIRSISNVTPESSCELSTVGLHSPQGASR